MSQAEAKIGLDVTGLETGTQRAEAAARRLIASDQRVKQQLEKALKPAAGEAASRFNAKMIGDIINMGTASNGAVMKVNALSHALRLPAVAAGGMVAVASAIWEVAKASNQAYIDANKMEETLNRVYRGGLGSMQSESSLMKKQEGGRQLKEKLEGDFLEDTTWYGRLKNNVLNSRIMGGMGADEARRLRQSELSAIRGGESEVAISVASKRAEQTGIMSTAVRNRHEAARQAMSIASGEAMAEDITNFAGTNPEAKRRIIEERKRALSIEQGEDKRKERIENTLLYSEKLRSTLRSSSDQEHAKQLQMELSTAKMVLGMTFEKQEREKATVAVLKAQQAIKENDLRVDLQRIAVAQGVTASNIGAGASNRTVNLFGDNLSRANAATQTKLAQSSVDSAVARMQRETESGSVSKEAIAEVVKAQNELNNAKNAQLKIENEIAFANKQTLATLTAQKAATYLTTIGRGRQAGILTSRTAAANQAELLMREGKPEQARQVMENQRLQEAAEEFETLGSGRNISRQRLMLARERRKSTVAARRFETFQKMGGGQRNIVRDINGRIISGRDAITNERNENSYASSLDYFHGGAVSPMIYNQQKPHEFTSKEGAEAIVKKLEELVRVWSN